MNFDDIVGQSALTANLEGQLRSGRIVHAYLFVGEAGAGKRTLASICARALLCTGNEARIPCDKCGPCLRALSGNHPDIEVVVPEFERSQGKGSGARRSRTRTRDEDSDGDSSSRRRRTVSVDDVRALNAFLSRKPFEGRRNVAIIPNAQIMTPQAQNALLKTLETPPGDSVIILTCENLRMMLPTIVSRCRVIHVEPLDAQLIREYLVSRGTPPERAHLLAALSGGSIGRALDMDGDAEYWQVRGAVLDALAGLSDKSRIADVSAQMRDMRKQSDWVMDILELYARDLMLYGQVEPVNVDRRAQLDAQAGRLNGLGMLMGVKRARERLMSNVGWAGVLDMICFDALEV